MVQGVIPDTQAVILDAAGAEVEEHGIRRTTVSDIARRARVSRQTLYRYWPDAQALLAALVTRELLALMPNGMSEPDPVADLDGFVKPMVDTADAIRRLPLLARIRTTDPELLARYLLERLGTSQRAIRAELATRIRAGQDAGVIRTGNPDALAATLLLIVQSAVVSAPLVREWLDESAWRTELGHAIRGYLAGPR